MAESDAVPEEQRHALFVFAHQDDEYGVLHVIEGLTRTGTSVVCLYLTDGSYGGQSSVRRNAESLGVLRRIGVACNAVHFVGEAEGVVDGQLQRHLDSSYRAARKIVRRLPRLDEIYLLGWEGGHQDHDAAHIVGMALAQSLGLLDRTRQFPLYNGFGLPWILFRVLAPLTQNGPVSTSRIPWSKRLTYALRCLSYPSQAKTWIGLFPFMFFDLVVAGVQRLQPVAVERLMHRPHEGLLLYERRGFLGYEEFRDAVLPFLERHFPAAAEPVRGAAR
jgi:LmbE family N-acetylglucosaminyl deacetylase